MNATININGITYEVISSATFEHKGKTRTQLLLRRPNGKRMYHAVMYETGTVSSVV